MSGVTFDTSGSTSSSLLVRVRRRDPTAWQRFADIYTPLVYAWARRGGLRETDAADVVQEVFWSASWNMPTSFVPWMPENMKENIS